MTTLANISGLDTIIFDSSDQQIANTTLAVLGLLAFFANVFIIYGGSKNSKATNTMLILLSLCCADVIMSFFMTIISCLNSITNGWVGGKMTCIISEIVTETTGLVTLTSMMLISLLNFIKIFKGVRVTDTTTLIFIAVIWTLSIALSAVVYTIYGFEEFVYLGTSKTVCTIAWHNPAGFPKTVGLIYLVIILLSLFLLITVECNCGLRFRYISVQLLSAQEKQTQDHWTAGR